MTNWTTFIAADAAKPRAATPADLVGRLVEILGVCCQPAASGLLEIDLENRPRPAAHLDQPDPCDDDTAARYGQLEMD